MKRGISISKFAAQQQKVFAVFAAIKSADFMNMTVK
jgi:hypothetical protein